MKVILYQPQIPQNAGNIVRTCAVTGCDLMMVRPLGFSTTDRWLKRAGLDYWEGVQVSFIDDLFDYLNQQTASFYFFSSHATQSYTDISYSSDSQLIFGSETQGLDPIFLKTWPDRFVTVPMIENARCLNLATTVGIGVYEAWRQQQFGRKTIMIHLNDFSTKTSLIPPLSLGELNSQLIKYKKLQDLSALGFRYLNVQSVQSTLPHSLLLSKVIDIPRSITVTRVCRLFTSLIKSYSDLSQDKLLMFQELIKPLILKEKPNNKEMQEWNCLKQAISSKKDPIETKKLSYSFNRAYYEQLYPLNPLSIETRLNQHFSFSEKGNWTQKAQRVQELLNFLIIEENFFRLAWHYIQRYENLKHMQDSIRINSEQLISFPDDHQLFVFKCDFDAWDTRDWAMWVYLSSLLTDHLEKDNPLIAFQSIPYGYKSYELFLKIQFCKKTDILPSLSNLLTIIGYHLVSFQWNEYNQSKIKELGNEFEKFTIYLRHIQSPPTNIKLSPFIPSLIFIIGQITYFNTHRLSSTNEINCFDDIDCLKESVDFWIKHRSSQIKLYQESYQYLKLLAEKAPRKYKRAIIPCQKFLPPYNQENKQLPENPYDLSKDSKLEEFFKNQTIDYFDLNNHFDVAAALNSIYQQTGKPQTIKKTGYKFPYTFNENMEAWNNPLLDISSSKENEEIKRFFYHLDEWVNRFFYLAIPLASNQWGIPTFIDYKDKLYKGFIYYVIQENTCVLRVFAEVDSFDLFKTVLNSKRTRPFVPKEDQPPYSLSSTSQVIVCNYFGHVFIKNPENCYEIYLLNAYCDMIDFQNLSAEEIKQHRQNNTQNKTTNKRKIKK